MMTQKLDSNRKEPMMRKHTLHILITIATLYSMIAAIIPTPVASAQTRNPKIAAPLTMHAKPANEQSYFGNPYAGFISKPQSACTPDITLSGVYKVYTFATVESCDWAVPVSVTGVDVLLVAGGGGGSWGAGGGGGGGQVAITQFTSLTPGDAVSIYVGKGGNYGSPSQRNGLVGEHSSIVIGSRSAIVSGGRRSRNCSDNMIMGCQKKDTGGNGWDAIGPVQNIGGGTGGDGSMTTTGIAGGNGFMSSITGIPIIYGNGGGGGGSTWSAISNRNKGAGGSGGITNTSGAAGVPGVVIVKERSFVPTSTRTSTNTVTFTASRTSTITRTSTSTATNSQTPTYTVTKTYTASKTHTPTRTDTPTHTSTYTLTPVIAIPTLTQRTNDETGQIFSWGDNAPYKLNLIPRDGNENISQIAIGAHHAIAITKDKTVIGWGTNYKGELTIPQLNNIIQIGVGQNHSVALNNTNNVSMWGDPIAVTAPVGGRLNNITQIATGNNHTVLLGNDGRVFVYGNSTQPNFVNKYIVQIAAGGDSSLALGNDGAVYHWGADSSIPTRVAGSVTKIFASGNLFGALRSDGELTLWGSAVTGLTVIIQFILIIKRLGARVLESL